jgi:HAMP domain-containing protein
MHSVDSLPIERPPVSRLVHEAADAAVASHQETMHRGLADLIAGTSSANALAALSITAHELARRMAAHKTTLPITLHDRLGLNGSQTPQDIIDAVLNTSKEDRGRVLHDLIHEINQLS